MALLNQEKLNVSPSLIMDMPMLIAKQSKQTIFALTVLLV